LKKLEEFAAELIAGEYEELSSKISQARTYIGEEADFQFIWDTTPTTADVLSLLTLLDQIFETECQAKYTVTTSSPETNDMLKRLNSSKIMGEAFSFLRLYGPNLSKAIEKLDSKISNIRGIKGATGVLIGKYDYAVEWGQIPSFSDIIDLIEELDNLLEPTGVTYKIATKSKLKTHSDPSDKEKLKTERQLLQRDPSPSISIDTK
jgi:hypothetical protein